MTRAAPIILAFDTATEMCSVALAVGARVLEASATVGNAHASCLLPMIDAQLAREHLRLADCDAIAFGAGPGSFTGVRIACGVAQGLAFGSAKPVIPIGNLAALAADAFALRPEARRVLAAVDARMNEIYWAVYETSTDAVAEVEPPALARAHELAALAARCGADTLAGNALLAYGEAAAAFSGARVPQAVAGAGRIAELARRAYAAGQLLDAAQAAPIYVRDRVALTVDERAATTLAAG